jgi:hypothetical protein
LISNNSVPTFPEHLKGRNSTEDDGDADETIAQLGGVDLHKQNMFLIIITIFYYIFILL